MSNWEAAHSSKKHNWATPPELMEAIHNQWGLWSFTLDACAEPWSAKAPKFYTVQDDGLSQPWNGMVWCNPPYGRDVGAWLEKAYKETRLNRSCKGVFVLTFVRSDTQWWHDYVRYADSVVMLKGRVKFQAGPEDTAPTQSAPAPSCLIIFRGRATIPWWLVASDQHFSGPRLEHWDWRQEPEHPFRNKGNK